MTGPVALVPLGSTWHHWGRGGVGWWLVAVVPFWVLLVGGIVLLLRGSDRWSPRDRPSKGESALEVLDRRFAEGQLSVEDYQTRRRILGAGSDGD